MLTMCSMYMCFVLTAFCVIGIVKSDAGYFWHVTDFHYDYTYHGSQLSCNADKRPTNPGSFGDFWCDAPWTLVNSSVAAMANIKGDVDFVLWTGDTILHGHDEDLSYSTNAVVLDNVTDVLKTLLPGVPVYASFGNHDYWPNNQFPSDNNMLYNDTWQRWRSWLNDDQDLNFLKGGYYTLVTETGLRIVALNTNLYYTSNKATLNDRDPADQLAWLNDTLSKARDDNEKVLITAHIPPGVHTPNGLVWMYKDSNALLVDILRRHANVIVGMHFGHDHSDGFKILINEADNAHVPVFVAPSVTPWRYVIPTENGPAHNPGIRLVKYDRSTGKHLNIEQYYLDLEGANSNGVSNWQLEYSANTKYDVTDVSGASLAALTTKMANSDSVHFERYWQYTTVSAPERLREECDAHCHTSILCGFNNFDMASYKQCIDDTVSAAYRPYGHLTVYTMAAILISLYIVF